MTAILVDRAEPDTVIEAELRYQRGARRLPTDLDRVPNFRSTGIVAAYDDSNRVSMLVVGWKNSTQSWHGLVAWGPVATAIPLARAIKKGLRRQPPERQTTLTMPDMTHASYRGKRGGGPAGGDAERQAWHETLMRGAVDAQDTAEPGTLVIDLHDEKLERPQVRDLPGGRA